MVTPPNYPTLGKTELAFAAAAHLIADYPDGQILLELVGASDTPLSPVQALQQVIRAFRPEEEVPEELPAVEKLYRSVLSGRRVLILADDARDAAQVRSLLPPVGCALLVTSRQRFTLGGMVVVDLGRLDEAAAVALLCGICARLTEEQARRIARLCGCLPLALRISAGILFNDEAVPVEQYLSQLADERQRLAHLKDPDDPALDVQANLLLSYATLDANIQALFRRLGVLAADADLGLVAAMLERSEDEVDNVLRVLLKRSLVEYDRIRGRWGLHDLVRTCALGLLAGKGEERVARLRYAEQVIRLIQQAVWRYRAGGDKVLEGLAMFDRERAHLDAVRTWLWAQPPAIDIDALVIREADAATFVGKLRDPLRTVYVPQLKRALVSARRLRNRAAEAIFLGFLAFAYVDLGEMRQAIEAYEQAFAIAHERGSLRSAYIESSEAHRLIRDGEQALAIISQLYDRAREGDALDNLGNVYLDLGGAQWGLKAYEVALALVRLLGDRREEGRVLGNLGFVHEDLNSSTEVNRYNR